MPTYTGAQKLNAPHATSSGGNAWNDINTVTPPAALTTADVAVLMDVPAGIELTRLRFRAGDFDTGTTLTVNIGYRTKLPGGSATNLTYFASASTAFQASTLTAWQELVFNAIKFDEPVEIVAIPAANATGVSGTPSMFVQAFGIVRGIG
jgi:hypothetical protein